MIRQDTDDYQSLFLQDTPIMDVRAPIEFDKGAFPNSQNIPLLNNHQREVVGTRYKDEGQDAAISLGLKLAIPEIRQQRMTQWQQFITKHPQGYLYCFRGGLRSRTTQSWLKEQGVNYPLISGGYKAMRTYLLQQMDVSLQQIPFVILSGYTGAGKTHVLQKTQYHIDLEGLANHRGSAFGHDVQDFQPTQINWENQLSIACLKYRHQLPDSGLLLEDEGKRIGRNIMPEGFHEKMAGSSYIFLERELEQRVAIICEEYITKNWPLYQQQFQAIADKKFSAFVLENLMRIKKRLGGIRFQKVNSSFVLALDHLFATGSSALFEEGINLLLKEYYDPMYQYQLQQKKPEILFHGTEPEILAWVDENLKTMTL
ncbi:MAG: tRNA 2-selenouridine(34) synthase MnmH [Methylococcaceae bacterium]|nr:tRNA 2-selenouridine(34) synthase MnmH [Methylococcaceae bacterium]